MEKLNDNQRIMEVDGRLKDMCESLKDHVDNLGMAGKIAMSTCDGVEIGYRVQEFRTYIRREVFVKTPGQKIEDTTKEERERIMAAVFDVFLVEGAGLPEITQIAHDCLRLVQDVIPMIQVERSPKLVSIVGGLG
jgi:hypothetical protein